MKIPKDLRKIRRQAEANGWVIKPTKNSHTMWIPPDPDKDIVIHAGSPSDPRAIKNHLSRLKDRDRNLNI